MCDSSGLSKHPVRGSSNGTCQKTTVCSRLVHNQGDITATIGQVNEQQRDLESRSLVVRGREGTKHLDPGGSLLSLHKHLEDYLQQRDVFNRKVKQQFYFEAFGKDQASKILLFSLSFPVVMSV